MNIWVYLLLLAIGTVMTLKALRKPDQKARTRMIRLGAFLALFGFIIETAGALAGLWVYSGSVFAVGFVPVEVLGIAVCAGASYAMLFPRKCDCSLVITSSFLIAVVGTGIEGMLMGFNVLNYLGPWTAFHALLAYWAAFWMLNWVDAKL
jgi:hypothetical protein